MVMMMFLTLKDSSSAVVRFHDDATELAHLRAATDQIYYAHDRAPAESLFGSSRWQPTFEARATREPAGSILSSAPRYSAVGLHHPKRWASEDLSYESSKKRQRLDDSRMRSTTDGNDSDLKRLEEMAALTHRIVKNKGDVRKQLYRLNQLRRELNRRPVSQQELLDGIQQRKQYRKARRTQWFAEEGLRDRSGQKVDIKALYKQPHSKFYYELGERQKLRHDMREYEGRHDALSENELQKLNKISLRYEHLRTKHQKTLYLKPPTSSSAAM